MLSTMLRLHRSFVPAAVCSLSLLLCTPHGLDAQKKVAKPETTAATANFGQSGNEVRTAHAFEAARARGPLALYAFLYGMPKGGDLHNHLSGAVYAESWLHEAAEDHLCIDVNEHAIVHSADRSKLPDAPRCEPTPGEAKAVNGIFPAASLAENQPLYDALVDAFSMRSFVPSNADSGHDHFFASFGKFGAIAPSHMPEWLDEVATRAAAQNEQYLELMHTPPFQGAATLAISAGFTSDYANDRKKMLAAGLRDLIPPILSSMDGYMASRGTLERCDTTNPAPVCKVAIRFEYQILRNFPPPVVFAQILLGFEVAAADPKHFLSINLVQPEDDFYAMRDYHMHMEMIAALHPFYPSVHITLHAGELAPGLVPPEGLTFHIRDAVETAGAERIGHGVDVMYEDHAQQLLKEMADKHVMVEINLTSNDGILNVFGDEHPFLSYLAAGVPVALSTDDEGVNRSNMTHEYTRAADTYPISYPVLKNMTRNSIAFSFLPGEPLWPVASAAAMYRKPAEACASSVSALAHNPKAEAAPPCVALLKASEKAAQQWELEQRFAIFESQVSH
jgi:adenosine deaminase